MESTEYVNVLNTMSLDIYQDNVAKGFDVREENIGQTLCLIHSEVSEALEAIRNDRNANFVGFNLLNTGEYLLETHTDAERFKYAFEAEIKDTFEDELADVFIRLMDLAGAMSINIGYHVALKRKYNALREFKHGKKF